MEDKGVRSCDCKRTGLPALLLDGPSPLGWVARPPHLPARRILGLTTLWPIWGEGGLPTAPPGEKQLLPQGAVADPLPSLPFLPSHFWCPPFFLSVGIGGGHPWEASRLFCPPHFLLWGTPDTHATPLPSPPCPCDDVGCLYIPPHSPLPVSPALSAAAAASTVVGHLVVDPAGSGVGVPPSLTFLVPPVFFVCRNRGRSSLGSFPPLLSSTLLAVGDS